LRILADECVWQGTIDFLRLNGHDVMAADEIGLNDTEDELILDYAILNNYVLITRDMDFSNILLYPPSKHRGLIVLKITPQKSEAVHEVLRVALLQFTPESIQRTLIIVDHNKFRIRRS